MEFRWTSTAWDDVPIFRNMEKTGESSCPLGPHLCGTFFFVILELPGPLEASSTITYVDFKLQTGFSDSGSHASLSKGCVPNPTAQQGWSPHSRISWPWVSNAQVLGTQTQAALGVVVLLTMVITITLLRYQVFFQWILSKLRWPIKQGLHTVVWLELKRGISGQNERKMVIIYSNFTCFITVNCIFFVFFFPVTTKFLVQVHGACCVVLGNRKLQGKSSPKFPKAQLAGWWVWA